MNADICDEISRLSRLLSGSGTLDDRVVVLVAHPDDETLGLSLLLPRLTQGLLVHATDARTPGDPSPGALSSARFAELAKALRRLGADHLPRASWMLPDGSLIEHVGSAAASLEQAIRDTDILVTHAFEGGHPDHDACALAADLACKRLTAAGLPVPLRLEFPLYAKAKEGMRLLAFDPEEGAHWKFELSPDQRERKRFALQAFHSQQHVIANFSLAAEALRPVANHDFKRVRSPDALLYPQLAEAWAAAVLRALA
jgi:LmbE family N-acetylglucosaminyl deacetylase